MMNWNAIVRDRHQDIKFLLKDNYKKFLSEMKKIFDLKKTNIKKDDFDKDIVKLFNSKSIHVFNELIIALLTKCGCGKSEESTEMGIQGNGPKKVLNCNAEGQLTQLATYKPFYDPINGMEFIRPIKKAKFPAEIDRFTCGGNGALPNAAAIRGRILIEAWENELDYVDDSVMDILVASAKDYMENIVSSVVTRRNGFKTRGDKFRYGFGCPPDNIYLKNNAKNLRFSPYNRKFIPSQQEEEPTYFDDVNAAQEIGSDNSAVKSQHPLSAIDLLDALKVHRNLLASNGVYTTNVERIIASLHHPTNEDEDQNNIVCQEKELKANLSGEILLLNNN